MNREHAFGNVSDTIDLGLGHFLRPIYELARRGEPIGTPIRARSDSPVVAFMLYHDCATTDDSSWRIAQPSATHPLVYECGICGDRGRIVNGNWKPAP